MLTRVMARAYDFIAAHSGRPGRPLTVRELQRGLNLSSPSSAFSLLERLKQRGYVRKVGDEIVVVRAKLASREALADPRLVDRASKVLGEASFHGPLAWKPGETVLVQGYPEWELETWRCADDALAALGLRRGDIVTALRSYRLSGELAVVRTARRICIGAAFASLSETRVVIANGAGDECALRKAEIEFQGCVIQMHRRFE